METTNTELTNTPTAEICDAPVSPLLPFSIIASSGDLKAAQVYNLVMAPNARKMADMVDAEIEIANWAVYNDVDKESGEVKEVLSIMDPDGEVYGTISDTFKHDFLQMQNIFEVMGEKVCAITVISGKSKKNREYITCKFSR